MSGPYQGTLLEQVREAQAIRERGERLRKAISHDVAAEMSRLADSDPSASAVAIASEAILGQPDPGNCADFIGDGVSALHYAFVLCGSDSLFEAIERSESR